jgi:hypothetical protein
LRLLSGNPEGVLGVSKEQLLQIVDWVADSDVDAALCELAEAETQLDRCQKAVAMAKKRLAEALRS